VYYFYRDLEIVFLMKTTKKSADKKLMIYTENFHWEYTTILVFFIIVYTEFQHI